MQDKRIIILARARGPFEHPPQARKQHRSGTGRPPIAPSGCAELGGCVTATARSFVSPPELRSERGAEGRSTTSYLLRTQSFPYVFLVPRHIHINIFPEKHPMSVLWLEEMMEPTTVAC